MDLSRIWHLVAVFCLTYVLIKIIQLHRRRQVLLKALNNYAGPPPHWLYGHVHEFSSVSAVYRKVEKWSCLYPFAFPLWFGRFIACLNITHPDYAKTILARTEPKDNFGYRNIIPWIGKGLLVLHGPKWAQHRKLLTPGFHFSVLKPYVPLIADSTKVMLDKWELLISQEKTVELFEHVSLMTLDSIMKCAFGYNSNCQMYKENSYVQAVFELCFLIYARMSYIVGFSDLLYWFSPHGFRFRKACHVAHLHTEKVIKERKKTLKVEEELQKIQNKRHLDFLDILLCAKDENGIGLSDEEVRAEVDTFMFEGHDTTASGISWLLYCLAQNPEHQERCREEIKSILGDRGTIEWDDLNKMTYCTLCIKESLRLYSPVPGVSRELTKPVTFFDGKTLPEGTWTVISIHLIHKNPSIWHNPEMFDPLRFSPENLSSRNSHAFLPFAAGPRNCIGQQFAMIEMKVVLAMTLLRFELSLDLSKPPPVPVPLIVLRSDTGIHLCLKKLG
ncbi:cytochrome P450 4B1 [Protobothrops mucrosquamatus]|uniref:cytochrome P450 4B1 n=1 Tax=Protobothrops mucrosquamatus TaxID=103944 RepID=UPI0007759394|nr:cytochrome P450 4B1 [Protobothrops mucrosquamatus]